MRRCLQILSLILLVACVALGTQVFTHRRQLARQWACYRVAAADSFAEAQERITRFDKDPDRRERLAELVGKWGTGNRQFDLYLARHVRDAASSELLRESFSRELDRRQGLPARWAHFWCFQARLEPDEQIDSVVRYFDTLASTDPSKEITYREVLDLRALLQLTAPAERFAGLDPTNWRQHYARWQKARPKDLAHVPRPTEPFAD